MKSETREIGLIGQQLRLISLDRRPLTDFEGFSDSPLTKFCCSERRDRKRCRQHSGADHRNPVSTGILDMSTIGQLSVNISPMLICNDYSGCVGSSENHAGKVGIIESASLIHKIGRTDKTSRLRTTPTTVNFAVDGQTRPASMGLGHALLTIDHTPLVARRLAGISTDRAAPASCPAPRLLPGRRSE